MINTKCYIYSKLCPDFYVFYVLLTVHPSTILVNKPT